MESDTRALAVSNEINFLNIPKNVVFPDELNRYLRDQIEHLMKENGILKNNLFQTEQSFKKSSSQCETLQLKLKEYEDVSNKLQFTTVNNLVSSKIVELSKKMREKNCEVEALKTKCSKLERKLFEIQETSLSDNSIQEKVVEKQERKLEVEDEDKIKKLQDKLSCTTMRLCEAKNANAQMKNELKIANKWLQQEIGESFETLNNGSTNWRGRAQVICDLQQKNSDLKEKLKAYQGNSVEKFTQKSEKKLENLSKENSDLKDNCEEMKRRLEVIKARCKVLETECTIHKSKQAALSAQTGRDQDLLKALTVQVSNHQNINNEMLKQKDKVVKSLQQDNEVLKIEISKLKCTIDNLRKQLEDKNEDCNDGIKQKNKTSRPNSSYGHKNIKNNDKIVSRLEAERSKLLQLTEMQNNRIASERNDHFKTQSQLRYEKQRAAKLESNLERLELEMSTARTGGSYCTMTNNSKVQGNSLFKDELELARENIKALRTRLEIEQHERKVDLQEFAKILQNTEL